MECAQFRINNSAKKMYNLNKKGLFKLNHTQQLKIIFV